MSSKKKDYLFEMSWEVCNKVGGIHTVITSKLNQVTNNFENYFTMGPYFKSSMDVFEYVDIPNKFKSQVLELEKLSIKLHFGKWLIGPKPNVILVEYLNYGNNINDIKNKLWEKYNLDSLNSSWYDFDEALLWSWVCGLVIDYLSKEINENILVHAHEWMSGGSISYFDLKEIKNEKVSTIFTTHATMLGRTITGNLENLYDLPQDYDFEKRAYELGVHTKHQFEKILSNISNSFTTVSDITAKEASIIYKKNVDVILYNGFDYNLEEYEIEKNMLKSREKINNFLDTLSYDSYTLNYPNTNLFYISGRYEIHNKGVDVLIRALSKLNDKLKEEKFNQEIVVWFMLMFGEFEFNSRYLHNITSKENRIERSNSSRDILQTPYELGLDNDVIKLFRENNLLNLENDKIKVILTPENFNSRDKLIQMNYYDLIQGFDLGILPSFYEPWGYTPAESLGCSVPCFTTDLSGIGRFEHLKNCSSALNIIEREGISDDEFVEKLYLQMYNYIKLSQKEKLNLKYNALNCVKLVSWDKFYSNYLEAYNIAQKN